MSARGRCRSARRAGLARHLGPLGVATQVDWCWQRLLPGEQALSSSQNRPGGQQKQLGGVRTGPERKRRARRPTAVVWGTPAGVVADSVHTGGAVLAAVVLAVVHVRLAEGPVETEGAGAAGVREQRFKVRVRRPLPTMHRPVPEASGLLVAQAGASVGAGVTGAGVERRLAASALGSQAAGERGAASRTHTPTHTYAQLRTVKPGRQAQAYAAAGRAWQTPWFSHGDEAHGLHLARTAASTGPGNGQRLSRATRQRQAFGGRSEKQVRKHGGRKQRQMVKQEGVSRGVTA